MPLYDETSKINNENHLEGHAIKQGGPRAIKFALYGRSPRKKELTVGRTSTEKQILYSQLPDGVRRRGRPCLRYKDTMKRNLKQRESTQSHGHPWQSKETLESGCQVIWKQSLSLCDRQHDDDDDS